MKKFLVISVLIIALTEGANAQLTKIGGGLNFGSGFHFNNETSGYEADLHRSPTVGIFLTGIYKLKLPVHIAPSFTFFLPRTNTLGQATLGEETKISEMMFDLNGHYVFNSLDRFEFYGLTGLNITFAKVKWTGSSLSGSDNALGLNIGAGTYMKLTEQIDLYGEAKYIVSKYDQFVVNAGLLINIDWLKKHEDPGI